MPPPKNKQSKYDATNTVLLSDTLSTVVQTSSSLAYTLSIVQTPLANNLSSPKALDAVHEGGGRPK
jgi:hypothetical protein